MNSNGSMTNITDRISVLELANSKFPEGLFVEIGAASGAFTKQILATCQKVKVVAIDLWAHQDNGYEDPCNLSQETQEERYRQIQEDFKNEPRVTLVREWSHIAATHYVDAIHSTGAIDLIYLDANHSYEAVKQDLEAWLPKLKSGGIFAGHDYADEVKRAVDDFCVEHDIIVFATTQEYSRAEAIYGPSWEGKSFYFIKP